MAHWIFKSEPQVYSFAQLVEERRTEWTGIRNFEARNSLRATAVGDLGLLYHSGEDKALVGIVKVTRGAQPDPTANEGDWVSIELEAVKALDAPLSLARLKADETLKELMLVKRSRLSVTPVTPAQFALILKAATTKQSRSTTKAPLLKPSLKKQAVARQSKPRSLKRKRKTT
jgi:predicted RNA-binding protein with PUA-like domain